MYSVIWPSGDAIQGGVARLSISKAQNFTQGDEDLSYPEPNQPNPPVTFTPLVIQNFCSLCGVCVPGLG